jgi:hypothetical protein
VFTLGPKAAILKLSVLDDATDTSIDSPVIILRNASDPNDWMNIARTADSTVLIPPDEDVQIEISAHGYNSWHSSEHPELMSGKAVHLHSGVKSEFKIRLKQRQE